MRLYKQIAALFRAIENCERMGNTEWRMRHVEKIKALVKEYLPSGSGFDSGAQFNFDKSKPGRLVFNTAFHHMNEGGYWKSYSLLDA